MTFQWIDELHIPADARSARQGVGVRMSSVAVLRRRDNSCRPAAIRVESFINQSKFST
jgi:hypothetical protein